VKGPQLREQSGPTVSILSLPRKVSTMEIVHPNLTEAKTLLSTSAEAKEQGRWDAERGQRCQAEAYAYADANSIHGSYLKGEYVHSYIMAKGL